MSGGVAIRRPTLELLPGYKDALERGWSPDNIGLEKTARIHLARIAEDPAGFVAGLTDPEAKGAAVTMPDGSARPRLPGFMSWIWEDGFCGTISLRWQNGTSALPDYSLGHIGYSIVPWRRRRGHATAALGLILTEARQRGLAYVKLTTEVENDASQKVIRANGGRLVTRRKRYPAYGDLEELLWRIDL